MPRTRLLHPEFFSSETLASVPLLARVVFQALWVRADREGRLLDQPRVIAAFAFPYENLDGEVALALDALAERHLITRYIVDDKSYLHITHFLEHQRPHPRERASVLPPPPNTLKDNLSQTLGEPQDNLRQISRATVPRPRIASGASKVLPEVVAKAVENAQERACATVVTQANPRLDLSREITRPSPPVSVSVSVSNSDTGRAVPQARPGLALALSTGPGDPGEKLDRSPDAHPATIPDLNIALDPLRALVRELLDAKCAREFLVDAMVELTRLRYGVSAPLDAIRAVVREVAEP